MTLLCALHRPSELADLYEIDRRLFDQSGQELTVSAYHNYEETPHNLEEILEKLPSADFRKIATFARSTIDALRMLDFVQTHPGLIGICMGELGEITRILAPVVGSPLTYAPENTADATAPGQLLLQTLLQTYHFRALKRGAPIFGLIGDPIDQSPGHIYHNAHLQGHGVYVKMRIQSHELSDFFLYAKKLPFRGLSITTPHKKAVLPFLDALNPEAAAIGAVNTIHFHEGKLVGYNTDGRGALDALGDVHGKKIAVLGAGGTALAIAHVANLRGAKASIVYRTTPPSHDILINATGADNPAEPLAGTIVMETSLKETTFLQIARAKKCRVVTGWEMYLRQAEYQRAAWGGVVGKITS